MKRSIIISLHAAYWIVYVFLTISTLIISGGNFKGNIYASFFLNTSLAVTCFYTFYFILVPKFLAHRKIKLFVLSALTTCIVSAVIIITFHVLFLVSSENPRSNNDTDLFPVILNWSFVVLFHAMIGLVHGLLATFMRGFFTWYDEIHIKELLEKKNIETQMNLIKARINPHFLFNTLNNIDVLIKNDAGLASMYLQKLCNIMRSTLYENQPERIPLEKELTVIREYIELESIRSATKDFISLNVSGEPDGIFIAPMVFMTFVENAIKHSSNRKLRDAIVVKVDIANDQTSFLCTNLIGEIKESTDGGIGIELIQQRLQLLYPNKHELTIDQKNGYFVVKLTITTT